MQEENIVIYEHEIDSNNRYRIGITKYKGARNFYIWPFWKDNDQWKPTKNKGGIIKSVKILEGIISGLLLVRDYLSKLENQETLA